MDEPERPDTQGGSLAELTGEEEFRGREVPRSGVERAEGVDLAQGTGEDCGMSPDVIVMQRCLAAANACHSREKRINAMTATIEVHVPARLLDAANEAFIPFEMAHAAINACSPVDKSRVVVRAIKSRDIADLEFHLPMGFIWKRSANAKD